MSSLQTRKKLSVNTPQANRTRVIKLGGSLLNLPDLEQRIEQWLLLQESLSTRTSRWRNIWITGGGANVERLRQLDAAAPTDQSQVHWACIEIMEQNAKSILARFPNWGSSRDIAETQTSVEPNIIFLPMAWLSTRNPQLPTSWDVTSDSIAATLAEDLNSDELVLLKSTDGPVSQSIQDAASTCFVDTYFQKAAKSLNKLKPPAKIRFVNFRSNDFLETAPTTSDFPSLSTNLFLHPSQNQ